MIAYLLDELPEAEAVRVEEEYLADDDAVAMLEALESELYDAYARNELPPKRRLVFEAKFLKSEEQRKRLAFSQALMQQRRVARKRPVFIAVAIFAAVLILAIELKEQKPSAPVEVIAAVTLNGDNTRSVGELKVVSIASAATVVRITAVVDGKLLEAVKPPFEAKLSTPEGKEVWKSSTKPPTVAGPESVVVDVPPAVLANGYYILSLSFINAAGTPEEFAAHSFVVRKP
jgi:hypothetical protein